MNRVEPANFPIDLAHTRDFALGNYWVRPSAREIEGPGWNEVLEPRIMQVLVALAQTNGAVVSRDDLVRRCWDGRIVGEDAINRCIAKLRRLAEADGGRTFTIDTIPRIGYRLLRTEQEAAAQPVASPPHPVVEPEAAITPTPAAEPPPSSRRTITRSIEIRHPMWVLAGLAVLGATIISAVFWLSPEKQWTVTSADPLVATPLIERHPALSPDGTMLAYSSGKDVFSRQIYVRRIAGGDPIRLTDDSFDDAAPNWSRDGTRIVYIAAKAGEPCHIFVVPVPAGLAREIGRCLTEERSRADWDANGQAVYLSDRTTKDSPSHIFRFDVATGARIELTHPPGDSEGDLEPSVSPDGREVGFARFRNEAELELIAYNLASGKERTLYKGASALYPSWSWTDDPKAILMVDNRGAGYVLRRQVIGGEASDLYSNSNFIGRLSRGPGGLFAVELTTYRSNLAQPPAEPGDRPVLIDPANNETWGLSFAPDGTLAMVSNRSGDSAIWLMPPGKPASELVAVGRGKLFFASFSPDGGRIAAVVPDHGNNAIRIFTAGGTQTASIPIASPEIGEPQWLPDGKALVFAMRDVSGFRIVRLDLDRPDRVVPVSGYGWKEVRLRGSDMFAVKTDQPGVWQLGETPRLITARQMADHGMQWKVAGDDIVFLDNSDRAHLRLLAQPIAGGPERVRVETPAFGDNGDGGEFAINPKNGQVVYTSAVQVDTDIHVLHLARR